MTTLPRTATLPRFGFDDLPINLGNDQTVVFRIRPIPGPEYERILDDHRDENGRPDFDAAGVDLMTAGIAELYSSEQSTPVPFDRSVAQEIEHGIDDVPAWPPYARNAVVSAVIKATTQGPAANPFDGSTRNGNDAS